MEAEKLSVWLAVAEMDEGCHLGQHDFGGVLSHCRRNADRNGEGL